MARTLLALAGLLAFPCLLVGSCSSADSSKSSYKGSGGSAAGGSGGDASVLIEDALPGSGGSSIPMDAEFQDVVFQDGDECVGIDVDAEPFPLDMYVLMDQSGSMSAPIGFSAKTQWDAIRAAFVNFLNASPTTGLGMGIQYFPIPITPWAQVLPTCDANNSDCGSGKVCLQLDNGYHCLPLCSGGSCANNAECLSGSLSDGGTLEYCSNDSCNAQDYATPEVEIGALPGNNTALIDSLNAHEPLTMTPTAPALDGAIQHAKAWASAHTDRKTVVVFATDGMPTVCTEGATFPLTKVKQLATAGVNGNPSILTFVIGVGSMVNNLNQVAQAGGTGSALIVPASGDVTAAFAAALEKIRGAMMDCEFKVPQSGAIDFGKVNVNYIDPTLGKGGLYYVGDASQCDPTNGGWYYDTDPAVAPPTKIILCPKNCTYIHDHGGSISIEMGCKTVPIPK